jgi:predicted ATPase
MTEELRFGFETRQVYHDRVHQLLEIYQRSTEVSKGVTDDDNITSSVVLLKPNSNHNDLVLISGPSGVGKTCLALSLEEQIMKQDGGFLCRGKFDQATFCPFVHDGNQDETPIATQQTSHRPFVTAMTDLVQQILRRGDRDFINLLQSELEEALDSSEIQALETNIPCLYQITRPPSSLSPNKKQELDGDERWLSLKGPDAEKRFVQIFTKLCQTISNSLNQRNSRMVMLIDDLQWADTHSLQLLQKLLVTATSPTEASASNKGLMVICTARLDEIASDDPLALVLMSNHESEARDPLSTLLSELKQSGVNVTEIPLDNLTKSATHELLSSFFKLPVTDTESLAQVVYHQTNGNLFYIMQFLSVLQGEGHLYVCPTMNRWKWNEQDILKTSLLKPKSIVTLLTQKILQLPDPEQHILRVAACLGGTIYDCLLEERVTYTPTSVQSALATLKQQHGLITFDFDTRCGSFVHNRIQEAAYSLIPTSHRAAVHLDLGRQLWKQLTPTDLDTHLFTVVSQIQRGLHLLDDRIEKEDLAALMLRAGEKAVRMSSFADAANYFGTGIHLLGRRRGWKHQYALSLALHNAAAEVEYYNGNLERVDSLLADVFVNAKSLDHKLRAHITQIYSLGSRDDMKQALAQGLEVLKSLGVTFPRRPGKMYASFALSRCRRLFQTKSDDDIMNLPLMNDKRQLVVMRLLNTIYGYAFSNNESLVALIATKMIETTFQYGISALSKSIV